jgi:putative transposase
MPDQPQIYHRRSIRLKGYDYTQPGAYFVTLVTQEREFLFGKIDCGEMQLSSIGLVAQTEWLRLTRRFQHVELDEFVVMPNHVHGIVVIIDRGRGTGISDEEEVTAVHPRAPTIERFGMPVPGSIPTILRSYKSLVTQRAQWISRGTGMIPLGLNPPIDPRAPTTVWQRNYYEHVIRDEAEWDRIREYIRENPRRWSEDRENPFHK